MAALRKCRQYYRQALFLAIVQSLIAYGNDGYALIGDMYGTIGIDAYLQSTVLLEDYGQVKAMTAEDISDVHMLNTSFRMMVGGMPEESVSYEIHLVQYLNWYTPGTGGLFSGSGFRKRYQALLAETKWWERKSAAAGTLFDRFNVKMRLPRIDVSIGRQAITFGKAYFWNPLDVFYPFQPDQLDRDYKTGVDAIRADISLGNFSGINLVAAAGPDIPLPWEDPENRSPTWDATHYGSAMVMRLYATFLEWDVSLQGGKVFGGYQIGGGTAGEIGMMECRLEAAYFSPQKDIPVPFYPGKLLAEDHIAAVIGIGRRFENTMTFEAEYLFNGAADTHDMDISFLRYLYGNSRHVGRHIIGTMISYDVMPIVVSQWVLLYSLSDHSALLQPALTISLSNEADMIISASVGGGKRPEKKGIWPELGSEFGAYPNLFFVQVKYYM